MSSSGSGVPSAVQPSISSIPDLPGEFENILPARLSQVENVERYLGASPAWIRVEGDRIGRTLARFAQAVADAMESPRCAHDFIQRLDLRTVSRDHNWRRIFTELADRDPCFDGHKRTLIIRYLQFLSERKRILDDVEVHGAGLEGTTKWPAVEVPQGSAGCQFRSLAIGETAAVELSVDHPVSIWMGDVAFSVVGREQPDRPPPVSAADPPAQNFRPSRVDLLGPGGYEKQLRLGRNILGRHPECDIVLDSQWRGLSRVHLILEWDRDEFEGPGAEQPAR